MSILTIFAALRFIVAEFAPLVVFATFAFAFNLKFAIAGSLAAVLIDLALRRHRRQSYTRLYLIVSLSLGLTIAFSVTQGRRMFPTFRRFGWLAFRTTGATGVRK